MEKLSGNLRFIRHKTGLNQTGKYGFCRILLDHFHNSVCCNVSYSVEILEKLQRNSRAARNPLDASIKFERKQHEKIWMHKLRILSPYGLNDRLGDEYDKLLFSNKFPPLSRKRDRVSRGRIHKNIFFPWWAFYKLNYHLSHNLSDVPDFFRVFLLAINKYNLKNTAILLQDNLLHGRNSIYVSMSYPASRYYWV